MFFFWVYSLMYSKKIREDERCFFRNFFPSSLENVFPLIWRQVR